MTLNQALTLAIPFHLMIGILCGYNIRKLHLALLVSLTSNVIITFLIFYFFS